MNRNYRRLGLKRVSTPVNTGLDTHELLKKEIMSDSTGSSGDGRQVQRVMPESSSSGQQQQQQTQQVQHTTEIVHVQGSSSSTPTHGVEDIYLHLDSLAQDRTSDAYTLQFRLSNLNNSRPIENIVAIRLGEFFLPRLIGDINAPDYFFYRRIYMELSNLPTNQGYRGANIHGSLTKHHFELEVDNTNSIAVSVKPIAPTFFFAQPLSALDQLVIKFMLPPYWGSIRLPPDTIEARVVPESNPATLQIVGDATTADMTHLTGPLQPNDRVAIYAIRFRSDNSDANNAMNSPYGLFVDEIIDNRTFSISTVSFANVTETVGTVRLIIAKNRITLPLRVTTIKSGVTNHLFPVHQ